MEKINNYLEEIFKENKISNILITENKLNIIKGENGEKINFYNHISNINVFTDFYELYNDVKEFGEELLGKYVCIDVAELNYDFKIIKNILKEKCDYDDYIIRPYIYHENKIKKDYRTDFDGLIEYIVENKFMCSKWLVSKYEKKDEFNDIYCIIKICGNKTFVYFSNSEIEIDNKGIINICKSQIKKIIGYKSVETCFEILHFLFDGNKLKNIDYDFKNVSNKEKFSKNIVKVLLRKKCSYFKEIVMKKNKDEIINNTLVNKFKFYNFDRIDENMDIIMNLAKNIKTYSLTFKYGEKYDAILKIKDRKFIDSKYNGNYMLVVKKVKDYKFYNKITNYIIERCNAKCHFGKKKNLLQIADDAVLIKKILTMLYENNIDISYKIVANNIYNSTKICSYFWTNISYGFYNFFNAKSVLDISVGWGDRLIAACIANIEYYGADPNLCNANYYDIMIELFGDKKKQKFKSVGFEDLEINKKYDLVFSSPPFFDLEIYSQDKTQSYKKYNTSTKWVNDFLYVCLKKAWKHLKNEGHMCLYLNDFYNLEYCEDMAKYCVENLENCDFLGNIGTDMDYSDISGEIINKKLNKTNPQPFWIFKKN